MYMNDGNKTKINLRNKSVFITGVAGFIGSNLAKRLLSTVEGVKVVGLDNMNHYYDVRLKEARLNELEQFDNFSFVKGNLADKSVIEAIFEQYKPEIVVNLGAQAGVRYSITNPDAYVEANLIGFYNILEACRHSYDEGHAGIRILIISSILYYLIWTVLALDKAPAQSVFFESISTSVILLPVAALLGFDDNIWNILENKLPYINILFCCCFYIAVFSFWANYGIKWPMNASYKGIFSCWFTSACIMTFLDFPQKDKRKLIYCNLLLIIAAAFITQSRAWVLQTLILLFIFVAVLGNRNRSVKILMGFLLIIIAVLGVSYVFPEITGNLFNRGCIFE